MNKIVIAVTGVVLIVPWLAMAQNVTVDANGGVHVDAGDGNRVDVGGTRNGNVQVTGNGVRVDTSTQAQVRRGNSVQDISSNSGTRHVEGNNVQSTTIRGSRVNIATSGGTATSTISGHTTSDAANAGGAGYVNGDLDGSNFSGRNLTGVDFTNASLNEAKFANSILIGADFTNAELNDADLSGANLRNAHITNTEFAGAKLDGAVWVDGRKCAKGSVGHCR